MKTTIVLLCLTVYAASCIQAFHDKTIHKIDITKRPFTVAILDEQQNFLGGGVLIGKQWVLTSAGILKSKTYDDISVRVGTDQAGNGGSLLAVEEIISHPNYNNWSHDAALVKLEKPVKLSHKVKIVKLAKVLPKKGTEVVIVDYENKHSKTNEITKELWENRVKYIPYKDCKDQLSFDQLLPSSSFCGSTRHTNSIAAGSPLIHNDKLIGIYSGSILAGIEKTHTRIFADIIKLVHWIQSIIHGKKHNQKKHHHKQKHHHNEPTARSVTKIF